MRSALPKDWHELKFGDLCEGIVNGGTPATHVPSYWNGKTPWVTGADFTLKGIGEIRRYVTELGVRCSATSVVKAGNLLVVTRTGVGKLAVAPFDLAISQDVTGIYLKHDVVDTTFTYYLLSRELDELKKLNQGTSIHGIVRSDLEGHLVRIPASTSEQQRIAAILTSIDNAIEASEALIEKHQQIKAGLMQDLFTRGVLPSGEIRPDYREAPSMYSQTPLGPLPATWAAQSVSKLLAPVANNLRSGPFGSALLKHELSESGAPLLGIDNVHREKFVPIYSRFVDPRKFMTLSRYAVRPGDVVVTIMGTVGRCCVLPDDIGSALSSKHLWTMTLDASRVIPSLVCWQLNHASWARVWFRRGGQGGIMDAIQSSTLKTLRLPVPPMDEQVRIADRYRAVQLRIEAELVGVQKLRAQKLGLMQDLLTGKVRVPLPEPEVVA